MIISASRREDIPAFRAPWLMECFKKGEVITDYGSTIDLKKTKVIVFWTKNAEPIIEYLDDVPAMFYFQFTLNDYIEYELSVPLLYQRIETFKKLSRKIGKQRVIWRFDPIIINDKIIFEDVIQRIKKIGDQLFDYTEKLVFSFVDPYSKLSNKFTEINDDTKHRICDALIEMNQSWNLSLETCAENFHHDSIKKSSCIDRELIKKLFGYDPAWLPRFKDKKQRSACSCITSTDIGSYRMCDHNCLYCYAK